MCDKNCIHFCTVYRRENHFCFVFYPAFQVPNYDFIFQLAELHVYLLPNHAWEKSRGLAEKDVVEGCISLGFVR